MQKELALYEKAKKVAIAHKGDKSYLTLNGFALGYYDLLETDNLDMQRERTKYFYSEKWYLKGKPSKVEIDYPFCLMLPPSSTGTVKKTDSSRRFKIVLVIVDLLYNDRDSNSKSAYSGRPKEQVWANCSQIGEEYIKELCAHSPGSGDNIKMIGEYNLERYYQKGTDRIAGIELSFTVEVNYCYSGNFDYDKEYKDCK